jgi:hypothetical protein
MEQVTGLFNRYLFTQIDLDSGSLTSLGVVMHSFGKPGLYRGQVRRGEQETGAFLLRVGEDFPQMQVDIDLAHLISPTDCCDDKRGAGYSANARGYVVFHVSDGPGGFHVVVGREDMAKGETPFDSRELHDGDLFAATILRPGTYVVANSLSKTREKADLVVAYPQLEARRYRSLPVQMVELSDKGFTPERLRVEVTQSQVFQIRSAARVRINLQKPDDGPRGTTSSYPGWRQNEVQQPANRSQSAAAEEKAGTGGGPRRRREGKPARQSS